GRQRPNIEESTMFPVVTRTTNHLIRPLVVGLGTAALIASLTACGTERDVSLTSAGETTPGGCVRSGDASVCIDENGGSVSSGDSSVSVGPDGGSVSSDGSSVSVGPDGGNVSSGDSSVSIGPDGGSVSSDGSSAGPSSGPSASGTPSGAATYGDLGPESGGGERLGTFGATGQVALTGAVAQQGSVTKASCKAQGDIRTLTAALPRGGQLVVEAKGPAIGTITVTTASGEWTGEWLGNLEDVVFLSPTSMRLDGASLAGDGTVTVSGIFNC
ncbi:MAG: hypothetical protein ACRCXL_08960, partial [Dermatophilaceae bacterium]